MTNSSSATDDPSFPFKRMEQRDALLRAVFDSFCANLRPTVIADVGAFNGDESFRFANILPTSSVYAFEASPKNFQQFFKNSERWLSLVNFTAEQLAVSDTVGDLQFNVLDASDSGADWRRAANSILNRADGLKTTKITVPCTTLDVYFRQQIDAGETFALWIDVEGALRKVLDGAGALLARSMFIRCELEWKELWMGQETAVSIKTFIESQGFFLFGDTFLVNAYDQSDVIFINKNVLDLMESKQSS